MVPVPGSHSQKMTVENAAGKLAQVKLPQKMKEDNLAKVGPDLPCQFPANVKTEKAKDSLIGIVRSKSRKPATFAETQIWYRSEGLSHDVSGTRRQAKKKLAIASPFRQVKEAE